MEGVLAQQSPEVQDAFTVCNSECPDVSNTYRYCKIFVDGPDVDMAKALLEVALGGTFERHTIYASPGLAVDVRRNTEATEDLGSDDFLYWQVLTEVDAEDNVADRDVVETTSKILSSFWDAGHRAVAACDFEDELPWSGGIQRLR